MILLKKIILFIKNIFNKQEEIKKIEPPKEISIQKEKINFIESLKVNPTNKRKQIKVETLICEGDGLGIQKKISY